MCVVFICCIVLFRYRSLRRADHLSRGVLLCVCLCVWSRNPKREVKGPSWIISACAWIILYKRRFQWPHSLKRRPWWLECWDRGFESSLRHGCLFSPFCAVLSCVDKGLCDGLITRPKESFQVSK
jgi:hypothetical protein